MTRRVLVTGASRGIGRAIALKLAERGFSIDVNFCSNHAAARETLRLIQVADGQAALIPFDVADRKASGRALAEALDAHGPYFGGVCNAGIHSDAPFPALGGDAWDRVLRTNLDSFYNVLRPIVMPMIRARIGGRIVSLSSISGLRGNRGQVNYSAAKAGLIGATRALALELAKRKITVNCVAPGLIQTDMLEGAPVDELAKQIPMRRLGTPAEVAEVVAFLFQEGAAYITGEVISVSGGLG